MSIQPPSPTQIPSQTSSPLRWRHTIVFCCLVVLGGLVIIEHNRLSALTTQVQENTQSNPLASFQERLAHLEQQLAASAHRPAALTQTDLDTLRQPLEERLNQMEQKQTASAEQDIALQAIAARLTGLETRLETRLAQRPPVTAPLSASASSASSAPAPARQPVIKVVKPKIVAPPFQVLGVEVRGGERFLSVSPGQSASLTQVRLLRPGESENGWTLETLEGQTAVFRVAGQPQRLSIP